jgi:ABC-type lipoprotein release transport system permease subunit
VKITGSESNLIFGMQPMVIAGIAVCAGVAVGIVAFWQKNRLGLIVKKLKERFTNANNSNEKE